MAQATKGTTIELPRPPFLWTLDQVAQLVNVSLREFKDQYVFYDNMSAGTRNSGKLTARDISPPTADQPEWRISETELLRWMRKKGFKPTYRDYY